MERGSSYGLSTKLLFAAATIINPNITKKSLRQVILGGSNSNSKEKIIIYALKVVEFIIAQTLQNIQEMTQQQQRAQKQQFLRTQIPQDLYEDFGQFCITVSGTVDIDGWTIQYIEDLVQKFKQFNRKQQQQLQQGSMNEQSFHVYQTSEAKDIKSMMQKVKEEQLKQQKEEKQRKKIQKEEKRKRKEQKERKKQEKETRKLQKQTAKAQQAKKSEVKNQNSDKAKQQLKLQQPKEQRKEKSAKKPQNKSKTDIPESSVKTKDQKIEKTKSRPKNAENIKQPQILNEQQFATLGSNAFQTGFQNSELWGVTQSAKDAEMKKKLQESFATNSHNFFAVISQKQTGKKAEQAEGKVLKDQGASKANMSKVKKLPQQNTEKDKVQTQQANFGKKKAPQQIQQGTAYQSDSQSSSSSEDQQNSENKENSGEENSETQLSETSISKHIPRDQSQVSKIHKGSSDSKEPHYKQNKLPYQGLKVIKESFSDTVPCFKATIRQALSHPKFKVVINQHQIIHRNFFVPDYVMYTVRTLPNEIEVKRNYEDFIKLRKSLGEVYPGIQLPYLQKTGWLSETHPDTIKRQKVSLQFFLNDIIYNKQLRNSRIIQDFLTFKQHKKMKRKFEEYDRLAKLSCIQQLCLLSGQVEVKLGEDQRIYEERISQYIGRMEDYFERHKKISQTLETQYQSIMKTFKSLSELSLEIEMETCQFNKRVQCNEIRNLQKSYSLLNKVYKETHENMAFDLQILNQKVMPFLRFEKENIRTLRQIIYTRNDFTKTYMKRAQYEKAGLNQHESYTSEKYKQYKNGVCEESKNMHVFKYQTAYLNNQVCQQSQRFFELLGNKINFRWSEIGKSYLTKIEESRIFWKELIKDRRSYISPMQKQ